MSNSLNDSAKCVQLWSRMAAEGSNHEELMGIGGTGLTSKVGTRVSETVRTFQLIFGQLLFQLFALAVPVKLFKQFVMHNSGFSASMKPTFRPRASCAGLDLLRLS